MRRLLGPTLIVLALAGLTGCGGGGDSAADPAGPPPPSSSSTTPVSPAPTSATPTSATPTSPTPTSPTPAYDVSIVSSTAAGGRPNPVARSITSDAALASFTAQFRGTGMATQLQQAVAKAPAGAEVLASVVAIGCDVPPDAFVEENAGRVTVTAQKVADPLPECLAPVTSVAVLTR